MPNIALLLPPAESKQPGGNPFAPDMFDYRSSNTFNYFIELNPERRALIGAVQEAIRAGERLEELFGVRGKELEGVARANLEIYKAPLMSALDRYSPGTLYKAMDFAGLPTGAQRRLLESGIIFSGMFGLLRPDDLIPDYRLSIDAVVPGVGKASDFWRAALSPVLNRALEGIIVWNLLPDTHRDAWDDDHSYEQMITVNFFEEQGGQRTPLSNGVKPLRGRLTNYIVRETIEDVARLRDWDTADGFQFDEAATVIDEAAKTVTVAMVRQA